MRIRRRRGGMADDEPVRVDVEHNAATIEAALTEVLPLVAASFPPSPFKDGGAYTEELNRLALSIVDAKTIDEQAQRASHLLHALALLAGCLAKTLSEDDPMRVLFLVE